MFFKNLSIILKIDDLPVHLRGWVGGNFKISKEKVPLVAYHRKGLFKAKILVKVVLSCDDC